MIYIDGKGSKDLCGLILYQMVSMKGKGNVVLCCVSRLSIVS